MERFAAIKGKHIVISPLLQQDWPIVYKWWSQAADLNLWFGNLEILSEQEFFRFFEGFLQKVVHVFGVIYKKNEKSLPIGMVYSYRANYLNGYTYLATFMDAEHRSLFYGAESALLFVDYLFENFPFRKIYAEVYGHNQSSLRNLQKAGWLKEAEFKEHLWRKGAFENMMVFATYRVLFYRRFSDLLKKIKT